MELKDKWRFKTMSVAMHHPTIGHDVYTRDGEHLGTVKAILGDSFKVDVPMHLDYWLASECISGTLGNRIDVVFPKHDLEMYKREIPNPG